MTVPTTDELREQLKGHRPLTPEGAFRRAQEVFVKAERDHPEIMEPWSSLVGEAYDRDQKLATMREGLRLTFRQRVPMHEECWEFPMERHYEASARAAWPEEKSTPEFIAESKARSSQ